MPADQRNNTAFAFDLRSPNVSVPNFPYRPPRFRVESFNAPVSPTPTRSIIRQRAGRLKNQMLPPPPASISAAQLGGASEPYWDEVDAATAYVSCAVQPLPFLCCCQPLRPSLGTSPPTRSRPRCPRPPDGSNIMEGMRPRVLKICGLALGLIPKATLCILLGGGLFLWDRSIEEQPTATCFRAWLVVCSNWRSSNMKSQGDATGRGKAFPQRGSRSCRMAATPVEPAEFRAIVATLPPHRPRLSRLRPADRRCGAPTPLRLRRRRPRPPVGPRSALASSTAATTPNHSPSSPTVENGPQAYLQTYETLSAARWPWPLGALS
jgi:hypothetical protein